MRREQHRTSDHHIIRQSSPCAYATDVGTGTDFCHETGSLKSQNGFVVYTGDGSRIEPGSRSGQPGTTPDERAGADQKKNS